MVAMVEDYVISNGSRGIFQIVFNVFRQLTHMFQVCGTVRGFYNNTVRRTEHGLANPLNVLCTEIF